MECCADGTSDRQFRTSKTALCPRCVWGQGGGCVWGFAEYARGGWRKVEGPDVHYERCGSYSASEDDPATR